MFSFFRKTLSSFLGFHDDSTENIQETQEERIFANINLANSNTEEFLNELTPNETILGQGKPVELDVETYNCVHKKGKITHMCNEYGLIDDVIYFEQRQISPGLTLKENDEVCYTAYKAKENEVERVYQIYCLSNSSWEKGGTNCLELPNPKPGAVEEIPTLTRNITGRVSQKRGREVFIESLNIWCNLDKINASYVPIEGDWVQLDASVIVSKESPNLSGEIFEVKSLKPLLCKTGIGRVTLWSVIKKEGAIENKIYFGTASCETGYTPNLGDEVIYDAIESDREGYRWRATNVILNELSESKIKCKEEKDTSDSTFFDKNGISIKPSVCSIEVEWNKTKAVVLEVTNNGEVKQFLKSTRFLTTINSQLSLKTPKTSSSFYIKPNETINFHVECKGTFLGLSGEIFLFQFENFLIARKFEVNVVGDKNMNMLLDCKIAPVFKYVREKVPLRKDCANKVSYGSKPWKAPRFVSKESRCVYNIPKQLWAIMKDSSQGGVKQREALEKYAPCLKEDLSMSNYADRFHTLLYMEGIEIRRCFKQFDMNGVFLRRDKDYLVLTVPGLVEKRPSIIIGDKVVVTQPWAQEKTVEHIGFVHEICGTEVSLKFHSSFQSNYDESECNVFFEPNLNFFSKCHEAINRALKTHGEKWLFPSSVNEKAPLFHFEDSEDSQLSKTSINQEPKTEIPPNNNQTVTSAENTMTKIPTVDECLNVEYNSQKCKRKLVWSNKKLNERQKLAVINALKAQGRPLPYIIFGPPGTGKTVTLVEIIIQIYRLLPESRILISTPSNSSADLICERLIEVENLKPGQLVRLMALYRIAERLIPEKLIPYSTFFSPQYNFGKNLSDMCNKLNVEASAMNEMAGRHRITVATCVTSGMLHYCGFPPGHFTHILIDEAGQTSEPEILISTTFQDIQKGQVILTGDPQQLGPVFCSSLAKNYGLGISLLQRLSSSFPYARDFESFPGTSGYDPRFITQLNVNYRTVPEILNLPSQMFYNSELIPTISQTDGTEADIIKKFDLKFEDRETPPAIIFHGIIGQNYQERDSPSWFNPQEVWQTVFYLRNLYSIGLTSDDIGIVSPYSQQVKKLKQLIISLGMASPKIGSVEEFQGQERYVIILTTVRSCIKQTVTDLKHSLGFVASPQRLNVALTRARALLIIIGNPFLLKYDPYWENVLRYCLKNKSYLGCYLEELDP